MTDIKSKLRDILNTALGNNAPSNGQTFQFMENNQNAGQSKGNVNYSGFNNRTGVNTPKAFSSNKNVATSPTESKSVIRLDFSLDSYKKSRVENENSKIRGNSSKVSTNTGTYSKKTIDAGNIRSYGSFSNQNQRTFDPLRRLDELLDNKGNGNESRTGTLDLSRLRTKQNSEDSRVLGSPGALNRSRENSINYSQYSTITRTSENKNSMPNNSNTRLKKEIEIFSKTLQDRASNTPGHVNRPQISLNKPELEINYQSLLEFSTTMGKRNLPITSNVMKNYVSQPVYTNQTKQENKNNFITISSYNSKPKDNPNSFNLNFSKNNKTIERDSLFNPSESGFRFGFSTNENKKSPFVTKTVTTENDVEDFGREFTNNTQKKISYIEKYSPKKKNKEAARYFGYGK